MLAVLSVESFKMRNCLQYLSLREYHVTKCADGIVTWWKKAVLMWTQLVLLWVSLCSYWRTEWNVLHIHEPWIFFHQLQLHPLTAKDEDDLPDTIRELTDVAASWRNIGTQLGIPDSQLETIQLQEVRPVDCLRQTLASWLRRNYNVKRFGEPTWVKLVEAVNDSAGGGNPSLAMKIARRHKGICRYGTGC